jgi:hypothetical protein
LKEENEELKKQAQQTPRLNESSKVRLQLTNEFSPTKLLSESVAVIPPRETLKSKNKNISMFNRPQSKKGLDLGKVKTKTVTLHQLEEFISELYSAKKKHDQVCTDKEQAQETLEQFMYTFLNNKYGLKTLVVEWMIALINAVKIYKEESHKVFMFAQILKNRCEEDFVGAQAQVADTITAILRIIVREEN